ncbi:hypothetical protein WG906_03405 [Pedobacter sp. P351]|uniref:hypothetical protein n=1 Tax=Pedobacter superstes TaxID=3133441 RepID=UPI003094887A
MKFLSILILTLSIISCTSTDQDPSVSKDVKYISALTVAEKFIKEALPGWEVASNDDYANLWWSFYNRGTESNFITSDFNDDEKSDFALLVKSETERKLKLLFLIAKDDSFKYSFAEDFEREFKGKDIQYGLFVESPKKIDVAYPEISSLILESNGISLHNYEINNRVYYIRNDSIKVFTVDETKL